MRLKFYISSSWKVRERVRLLARCLEWLGQEVYDFTNPKHRQTPEIPPERFPEPFDPARQPYREYLEAHPEWRSAVTGNRKALDGCDVRLLLLPSGQDAHADWAYAVGRGKATFVLGQPPAGSRTPTHLWAERLFDSEWEFLLDFYRFLQAQTVPVGTGHGTDCAFRRAPGSPSVEICTCERLRDVETYLRWNRDLVGVLR